MLVRRPIEPGILPLISLSSISTVCTSVSRPIDAGMLPVRSFDATIKRVGGSSIYSRRHGIVRKFVMTRQTRYLVSAYPAYLEQEMSA